ncbi:MAG: PD-(D/E)XK nuclease-like domain-containing protein [Sediminibacterium sp.]|nr:PD-(D/E)XK nuclease-like domain-containing protein [Sediminibacterium sp.]
MDFNKLCLNHKTRYEDMTFFYEYEIFEKAIACRDAFLADPLLSKLHAFGAKREFLTEEFVFSYEGRQYIADTAGEMDLDSDALNIGCDIKTTKSKTLAEFEKAIVTLFYDQQGAFYMDNTHRERYIFAGISKTVIDPRTKLPQIFKVAFDARGRTPYYKSGKERYSYWMHKYLESQRMLIAA